MTQLPPELLRAICDRPHDDNLRLIAADWWDEQGETDRAEFVRLQIKIAEEWTTATSPHGECWQCNCARRGRQHTNGKCLCTSGWCEFRRRERELLDIGYAEGWNPFSSWISEQWFRRGMVDEVHCRLADWAGGECTSCDGGGGRWDFEAIDQWYRCPECHGTGRVGGHGPAIVACQPVTRLVLTDAMQSLPLVQFAFVGNYWLGWARRQAGLTPLEATNAVLP